ncbi:GntR family transcriptional regulator [Microbacterium rhizomatis]|uniref:GntR family transcriptional regulator n=1 Tax=Microbacterium rhizomatis TaxID=1631477 RepID=A0A5J5IYS8_9MICO|nr:GntR family transcriptional regulator [Microbacterium rhizomatis]KAA9107521.1 GntR family transcriptional regulator [Microbacterium rhizomatis]
MDIREMAHRQQITGDEPIARQVQAVLLAAIAAGELVAGDVLHDHEWASVLGVSRTPIREAVRHLHGMGLLEVAAARYTRLRAYGADQAAYEARDWALLHHALTVALVKEPLEDLSDRLCRVRDLLVGQTHPEHVRAGNFTFFDTLRTAAPHSTITLGAAASAYRLRLAEPALPHRPRAHTRLHNAVIHTLVTRNPDHALAALTTWTPAPGSA